MIKDLPNFSHAIFILKIYVTTNECMHVVMAMSIFKYFKCVATEHEDEGLPERSDY